METSTSITAKLVRWGDGDAEAFDDVYPEIEHELRKIARSMAWKLEGGETLRTTALIDEAYIRLSQQKLRWRNRSHFYAMAATMMRRVLSNRHRDARRKKRGGEAIRISLSAAAATGYERPDNLVELDAALNKLEAVDPRKAAIVEMRYFGGLTNGEVAEVLDIAKITVIREWNMAKAFIYRELGDGS